MPCFNMFLFVCFQFCSSVFFIIKKKKKLKNQKNTKIVCVFCTLVLGWPLKQSFLNFISFCNLDEHFYAQLSK